MKETEIVILQTSDVHGNIFPINYATNEYADVGLGKLATLIHQEREKNAQTILIDNGDLIQGTPLTYHYAKMQSHLPNPMILLANKMGYDAAIFGNHEFNYGKEMLQNVVDQSEFPWLSATILDEVTNEPYYGKPYIIKDFPNGLKIGILGLTTPYIPNWEKPEHIQGMKFIDAVDAAKYWVDYLKNEKKVDIVIVSYHGGFERHPETGEQTERLTGENQGYQLCMDVPGIDVLLTGHQHRQISGMSINDVIIIQPGNTGIALGKVTLTLQKDQECWKVVEKHSELLSTKNVQADIELLAPIKIYEQATQTFLDQPIGKIDGDMIIHDPMAVRLADNPFIEFINQVQMYYSDVDISNAAVFSNKSPGFPKNVTMRDVMANYIYPNTLKVLRISGQDMKDALERSATYFNVDCTGDIIVNEAFSNPKPQHYNYDMWEGITYIINVSRPIGTRITKLEYKDVPVEMTKEYDVVMNNYRAGGGGEYPMFQNKPVIKDIPIDVSELLANYFLEKKIVHPTLNNNWKVTQD